MPTRASLWRHRDFVKLWVGQTISEIGSRITREGLPLTAVLVLAAQPAQMGILAALGGVAALAAGPLAGALVDRWPLRAILIGADLGRALVLASIPLAVALGALHLWWIYGVVLVAGALTLIFDVGYQSLTPALVEPGELLEANSKLALSASAAEMVGPALTGVLVQTITAPRAILLDALSFLVSAGSLTAMGSPGVRSKPLREPGQGGDAAAGLRYLARHPVLRALALRTALGAVAWGGVGALYVLYAIQYLHLKPAVLGLLITLGGASSVAGSLLVEWLGRRVRRGRLLIAAAFGPALVGALLPLAHGPWYLAALFLGTQQLVGDLFWPVYNVHELTLRQQVTPPALLGRVNAAMQLLFRVLYPAGALAGGIVASRIGVRATLWWSVAGMLASAAPLVFSPVRRLE